jgi:hypothetical protein
VGDPTHGDPVIPFVHTQKCDNSTCVVARSHVAKCYLFLNLTERAEWEGLLLLPRKPRATEADRALEQLGPHSGPRVGHAQLVPNWGLRFFSWPAGVGGIINFFPSMHFYPYNFPWI